jgi:hypothetical protein
MGGSKYCAVPTVLLVHEVEDYARKEEGSSVERAMKDTKISNGSIESIIFSHKIEISKINTWFATFTSPQCPGYYSFPEEIQQSTPQTQSYPLSPFSLPLSP